MNTIRKMLEGSYDEIKRVLEKAYMAIARYQKNRTDPGAEELLGEAIDEALGYLCQFKPYIPLYKQRYYDILEQRKALALSPRDLIMTFDRAVYELHTRLERSQEERDSLGSWSPLMKELLDGRRKVPSASSPLEQPADFIAAGLTVVGGYVVGRVRHVEGADDLDKICPGEIVTARMTTPEIILAVEKVAGIVTEQGGTLCHAAILAREFNIPCVVGCGPFIKALKAGSKVILNASAGILLELQEED